MEDLIATVAIILAFSFLLSFGIGFAIGDEIAWGDIEPLEGEAVNELRPDYDLGACRNLEGDVSVILYFMQDFESDWSFTEILNFTTNEVVPALEFLEAQAADYGVYLNFEIVDSHWYIPYKGTVVTEPKKAGTYTIDVLFDVARFRGLLSDHQLLAKKQEEFGTEVICLTIFNKEGVGYTLNPSRGDDTNVAEHCIVFSRDPGSTNESFYGYQASLIAAEILYLYGAEKLYATPEREELAYSHYPYDVMLDSYYNVWDNEIDDATAFYIGWLDEAPRVLYREGWKIEN